MGTKPEVLKARHNIKILDDILEPYLLSREHRKRTSHYSSDALACDRQLYWRWKSEEVSEPQEVGGLIKMEFGNKAEEILSDSLAWAKQEGLIADYDEQNKIYHEDERLEFPISAKRDYLIYFPGENEPLTCELKSSFGRGVKSVKDKGPKNEYLVQIFIYGRVSNDYGSNRMVFLGRDNGYRTEFFYQVLHGTQEEEGREGLIINNKFIRISFDSIVCKFQRIENNVKFDSLPRRSFFAAIKNGEIKYMFQKNKVEYKTDWQCNYCEFQSKCWKEDLKKYRNSDNAADLAKHNSIKKWYSVPSHLIEYKGAV